MTLPERLRALDRRILGPPKPVPVVRPALRWLVGPATGLIGVGWTLALVGLAGLLIASPGPGSGPRPVLVVVGAAVAAVGIGLNTRDARRH